MLDAARSPLCAFTVAALFALPACGAPIQCPPRHSAKHEVLCPACSAAAPCPCSKQWTCRPDDDLTAERAEARRRAREEERERQDREAIRLELLERRRTEERIRDEAEARARAHAEEQAARAAALAAERERAAREAHGHLMPVHMGRDLCSEACPRGSVRHVRYVCARGVPDGTPLESGGLACPNVHPPTRTLCAVPWEPRSTCEGPTSLGSPAVTCRAGPRECCLSSGKVVRPCGPVTRAGHDCNAQATCGAGGFCTSCR